jgi:hypothetical protein
VRRARGAALALALAAAGCAGHLPEQFPFTPTQPRPASDEGAWAAVRDRFTASAKLYDGLTTRAFVSAVYQARAVRAARVVRVAAWRNLTPAERDALLASEQDEAERFEDFIVSLFTSDRADNDLDSTRSVWRVVLVVEGEGDAEPVRIEQVRPDATLRTLYPTIGDFDTVYRVRFPRWPHGSLSERRFILRLAGARGRVDLAFPAQAPR